MKVELKLSDAAAFAVYDGLVAMCYGRLIDRTERFPSAWNGARVASCWSGIFDV
jgi:hypothetical protein